MVVQYWAQANLYYCPAASKNNAQSKSGQNWLENKQLNPWHTVCFLYWELAFAQVSLAVSVGEFGSIFI